MSIPSKAKTERFLGSHEHNLIVGAETGGIVLRGVDDAPFSPSDDLVEHRRGISSVESAVVIGGPHQVLAASHHGNGVAVFTSRSVRKIAQCG